MSQKERIRFYSLVGLRALERCADILKDYKIFVFSNTSAQDIIIATKLFSVNNGIEVVLIPENTSHEEILEFHGQSRIYIGLSIGDGISTSLLESMAMGSFPIQSCTACANEWIEDGKSGFIVPPEDPDIIEIAIRKALRDDDLVDFSATCNFETIKKRANYSLLKDSTLNSYKNILNLKKNDIKF
jgi:glycosyltransferase involved in cell wall biosynthesis